MAKEKRYLFLTLSMVIILIWSLGCSDSDSGPGETIDNGTILSSDSGTGSNDDGDGIPAGEDNCPNVANSDQVDEDLDKIGDACDNCPTLPNADQADKDRDGIGNLCDNCPDKANPDQLDDDADFIGDSCDRCKGDARNDPDEDSICASQDNCPYDSNADQADADHDGIGDVCEVTNWQTLFGGADWDEGTAVLETKSGDFMVAGWTGSFGQGGKDGWLIKTDRYGIATWQKTLGGTGNDYLLSLAATQSGGYILAGYTDSVGQGQNDLWLVKTDAEGNKEWEQTFGGKSNDFGAYAIELSQGGFLAVGYSESFGSGGADLWLVKTDEAGNELWNKSYGGIGSDYGAGLIETKDGQYLITGYTESYNAEGIDLWLLKTDPEGKLAWQQTFGGKDNDFGSSIVPTRDGDYLMAGETYSTGKGGTDAWLLKVTAAGNKEFEVTLGGKNDDGSQAALATNDGYIMTGRTDSYSSGPGDFDLWLVKIDEQGQEVWSRTYGGPKADRGNFVFPTMDGGFIVTGLSYSAGQGYSDLWLIKTNAEGQSLGR
jgi:hypothetical protein